jgi:sirohydrochlorin cobaltochelatase
MKKQFIKILALVLTMMLCLSMAAGCATQNAASPDVSGTPSASVSPSETTPDATPGASPVETPEKVLLTVSFGTSYNDSRDITIGAIENALQAAFPDYQVRRAFTSQIIIDILSERDGLEIDNVTEAMSRLVADGVKEVIIQPTHVMSGFEYDDVIAEATPYVEQFESFTIGAPLITSDEDYDTVVSVIGEETRQYAGDGTAIVFMGHGTHHEANATYAKLQEKVTAAGYSDIFIGTVESEPSLEDMLDMVAGTGARKVVLLPLMIVAGDHANNDMAGDEPDSWKSAFEAAGYEVECVLSGLGQYKGIQELVVKHATEATAPLLPIYGNEIKDETYAIEVSSSSSMFKIVDAQLTVAGGKMTAVLTLSGDGYEKLYMGTGEQALADTDEKCIYFVKDAEGMYTYEVPVEALDKETDVAAWSINKQQWYDRVLVFLSAQIPADAFIAS